MVRLNQIIFAAESQYFVCQSCNDRAFGSEMGLLEHCRYASYHRDEWCERCKWLFVSPAAHNAHLRHSHRHWLCDTCSVDESSRQDLMRHMESSHSFCMDCGVTYGSYQNHRIHYHHRCTECEREFGNENEKTMHMKVHLPRNHQCYGCPRTFPSTSAVLIHLESKKCPSGSNRDVIDEIAFEFNQRSEYVNGQWSGFKY